MHALRLLRFVGCKVVVRRRTAASIVTETLDQVLATIPAASGDERVLTAIREQTERISRG